MERIKKVIETHGDVAIYKTDGNLYLVSTPRIQNLWGRLTGRKPHCWMEYRSFSSLDMARRYVKS